MLLIEQNLFNQYVLLLLDNKIIFSYSEKAEMNIFHIIIIHNYLEHMVLQDHFKLPLTAVYLSVKKYCLFPNHGFLSNGLFSFFFFFLIRAAYLVKNQC